MSEKFTGHVRLLDGRLVCLVDGKEEIAPIAPIAPSPVDGDAESFADFEAQLDALKFAIDLGALLGDGKPS